MKVTVLNPKVNDLNTRYAIGSKLTCKKVDNPFDNQAIAVFDGTTEIGYIAAKNKTKVVGTMTSHDIYDDVEDEFTIEVVAHEFAASTNKPILVCEVLTQPSGTEEETESGFILINAKVQGSSTKYPAKSKVIAEMQKGVKTYITLNEKLETIFDGELAGYIKEDSIDADQAELLKTVLAKGKTVEAKVVDCLNASYRIDISIDKADANECQAELAKSKLDAVRQSIIDKGYAQEEIEAIEDYLMSVGMTAEDIQDIFSTYKPMEEYDEEAKKMIPTKPSNLFKDSFGGLKVAYATIMEQMHILCSGEKGLGKNCFVETVAWMFQRPLWSMAINRDTDKIDVCGSKSIECEAVEGGIMEQVVFVPEILVKAMRNGGIINIDEINFGHPGVLGLLHSISDDRRQLEVPGYGLVKADPNFCIIGTMNVGYAGTYELNDALADRFVDVMFPPNASIFEVLEGLFPTYSKTDLRKVDKIYQKMHEIIEMRGTELEDKNLTVRGFIQALKLSKRIPLKQALIVCVADKSKDYQYNANIKEIIENMM